MDADLRGKIDALRAQIKDSNSDESYNQRLLVGIANDISTLTECLRQHGVIDSRLREVNRTIDGVSHMLWAVCGLMTLILWRVW